MRVMFKQNFLNVLLITTTCASILYTVVYQTMYKVINGARNNGNVHLPITIKLMNIIINHVVVRR